MNATTKPKNATMRPVAAHALMMPTVPTRTQNRSRERQVTTTP
jgi:hypothetical protein